MYSAASPMMKSLLFTAQRRAVEFATVRTRRGLEPTTTALTTTQTSSTAHSLVRSLFSRAASARPTERPAMAAIFSNVVPSESPSNSHLSPTYVRSFSPAGPQLHSTHLLARMFSIAGSNLAAFYQQQNLVGKILLASSGIAAAGVASAAIVSILRQSNLFGSRYNTVTLTTATSFVRASPLPSPADFVRFTPSQQEEVLCCPITQAVFTNPVLTADGHSYERDAIQQWLQNGHRTSPCTGLPLPSLELQRDVQAARLVDMFECQQTGGVVDRDAMPTGGLMVA